MSDSEESDIDDTMSTIHSLIETLSHESKKIYSRALKIHTLIERPDLDLWSEEFHLHERAYKWAKKHLVTRKCSLWQIHTTLLESAKRDKRISRGKTVRLVSEEAEILDLPSNQPISVWQVLGKLPRFFL